MTGLEWASVYVAANLIWLLVLAIAVVRVRLAKRVATGDGGHPEMHNVLRAHGNAVEYAPAGLIGVVALALLPAAPVWSVHVAGLTLTAGRVFHAFGMWSGADKTSPQRGIGMLLTWLSFLFSALALLWFALTGAA